MKYLAVLLFALIITGCTQTVIIRDYELNVPKRVTVGTPTMTWAILKGGGIKKQLIYSGIAQNVLQISYREFYVTDNIGTLNYARPAFTQDLKYDLGTSREIAFQDIANDKILAMFPTDDPMKFNELEIDMSTFQ